MIRKDFLRVSLLAALMPARAFAQQRGTARPSSERNAQSLLSAFISYTDLRIASIQHTLETLSSASEVRSGQWPGMKDLLSVYQRSDNGLIVWYVRPDGTYYTVDKGLMKEKLSDRSYFPDLMAGKNITGALVVSKSTGQRSAVIAIPIKKGAEVVGAVGTSVFLDKLAEQVGAALDLPPDMAFFALAPNGLTTLHKKTDRHFVDPRELGSETLKRAANEMLSRTSGKTSYEFDNATKTAIYGTSPLTQWRFAIVFSAAANR